MRYALHACLKLGIVTLLMGCTDEGPKFSADDDDNNANASVAGPTSGAGGAATGGAATGGTTSSSNGSGGSGGAATSGGGGFLSTDADCSPSSGDLPALTLTPIAGYGFDRPMGVTAAPGDDERLFVVERGGVIRVLNNGNDQVFLDISSRVHSEDGTEHGLLGVAFHPNYQGNGRFFVHYSHAGGSEQGSCSGGLCDLPQGATVVQEFEVSSDPEEASETAVGLVYAWYQPTPYHNAGSIAFSPDDGYLYVALGDGGWQRNYTDDDAQDPSSAYGSMMRFDVDAVGYAAAPGGLSGNPTASSDSLGLDAAQFEGAAYHVGFRNPFRWAFDVCTGDLYVGDVGDGSREEVSALAAGAPPSNFGWPEMEGSLCYVGDCSSFVAPIADYETHVLGCSAIGGAVYRASSIPALRGYYLYSDFCSGQIWATQWNGTTATVPLELGDELGSAGASNPSAFGQDNQGNVYLVDYGGTIARIDPL